MADAASSTFNDAVAYERYVGRWSRVVAKPFLAWLGVAPGGSWLDVGAGTGILTQAILDHAAPGRVVAVDLSDQYLTYARTAVPDARVDFVTGDAAALALDGPAFDAAVSGLLLNFVPSPRAAALGLAAAVKPAGIAASYVWDYGDRMQMIRHFWDAAIAVDGAAETFHAAARYDICDPNALRALFDSAGLSSVEVAPIDVATTFASFDDLWLPFLGAQGSVAKYLRSRDEAQREAIRERLLDDLPIGSDGTIPLSARAWAVKGTR
ncbi:MAG: methyltransferase domain-containing protein [Chloroflexi bacterium]|nr:methyltransferase domain-containing protein [Chloroflexota bacterium]